MVLMRNQGWTRLIILPASERASTAISASVSGFLLTMGFCDPGIGGVLLWERERESSRDEERGALYCAGKKEGPFV